MDGHISRLIRRCFRRNAHFQNLIILRLVCRILQIQTLMGQMPDVLILGVVGLTVDLQRNVMCFCVINFLVTAVQLPETPRSQYLHLRCKCLDCQLETYLVIALAGAAMYDGIAAFSLCDLYQFLCDDRTCKGSTQQIAFVICACLHGRDDVIIHKFLGQVHDIQLGSAGSQSLFLQAIQLTSLANITGDGNDFTAVVFLQPRNEYGCIQTAGICEGSLLNGDILGSSRHFIYSSMK